MIGSDWNAGFFADGAHGVVAVHLGHHDVHQDDVDVGRAARAARSPPCRSRRRRPSCPALRGRSSSRRCCGCRRRRRAPSCRRAWPPTGGAPRSCARFGSGSSAIERWRKSAASSKSRSGERTCLSTMLCARRVRRASSACATSRARRRGGAGPRAPRSWASASISSNPRMSASSRPRTATSKRSSASESSASLPGAHRPDGDVGAADAAPRGAARASGSRSATRTRRVRRGDEARQIGEGLVERVAVLERLAQDAPRAHAERPLALLLGGDHLDGDVARHEIVLEPVEHAASRRCRGG